MSSIRTKVWGLVDTTTNKLLDIALYYNAVADLSGNFEQPTRIIRLRLRDMRLILQLAIREM